MQKIVGLKGLQQLLKNKPKVICDFYATWCGPCQMIAPRFEQLSKEQKFQDITFAKIDVDENEDIAMEYEIDSVPTFMTFNNAEQVERFSSADIKTLEQSLEQLLNNKR